MHEVDEKKKQKISKNPQIKHKTKAINEEKKDWQWQRLMLVEPMDDSFICRRMVFAVDLFTLLALRYEFIFSGSQYNYHGISPYAADIGTKQQRTLISS